MEPKGWLLALSLVKTVFSWSGFTLRASTVDRATAKLEVNKRHMRLPCD